MTIVKRPNANGNVPIVGTDPFMTPLRIVSFFMEENSAMLRTTLRISGVWDLHQDISEQLGVSPTSEKKQGQSLSEKYPFLKAGKVGVYPKDVWLLDAPAVPNPSLAQQLKWIYELISPKISFLKSLKETGADLDIVCSFKMKKDMAEFKIDSSVFDLFSQLGISITFLIIRN